VQAQFRSFESTSSQHNTLNQLEHIGYAQIDTLSVVQRAHHHVLYTRNPQYHCDHIAQLLSEKKIFEYWSHAAAYLPMRDFRFSLIKKQRYIEGHHHWFEKNSRLMKYVLDRIRTEGPMESKDFEHEGKRGSWFDWKPAKIALEQLYMEGSLMVLKRNSFRKVYDLTERVLPSNISTECPTPEEHAEHLITRYLTAQGIGTINDICHLQTSYKTEGAKQLHRLVEEKKVIMIKVEHSTQQWFSLPVTKSDNNFTGIRILSPFDNLIIKRDRTKVLFDFDYQLECYLPESKRKFGYFSLPILSNDSLIARSDMKADARSKTLIMKSFDFERKRKLTTEEEAELFQCVISFAKFNNCLHVKCEKTVPTSLRRLLFSPRI
jgi:uncharacterized protein YcaQ